MSTSTATKQTAPHSAIRWLVARYPAAVFLVMVYTVSFAFTLLRTQGDIRLPFDLTLLGSLGHLLGVALPAFLVVAACCWWGCGLAHRRNHTRDRGRGHHRGRARLVIAAARSSKIGQDSAYLCHNGRRTWRKGLELSSPCRSHRSTLESVCA